MTGSVSVVIPWRDDAGPRHHLWFDLVAPWWARHFPSWSVTLGSHEEGAWCKAGAVADGLQRAVGDVLVLADADVLPEPQALADVVTVVRAGQVLWGMPHKRVVRLTQWGTAQYAANGTLPVWATTRGQRQPTVPALVEENHRGAVGGGCVVLTRNLYDLVPLDRRFRGWGAEDVSFGHALTVVTGPPWRPGEFLWHLWHPPQQRLNRRAGSAESMDLYRRYRATTTPEAMLALVAEASQADIPV